MARIEVDPNYSSPTFPRATAPEDPFKKEDLELLAAAFSTHIHDGAGQGLGVTSAVGGSLRGTVNNATISLPQGVGINGYDPSGIERMMLVPSGTSFVFLNYAAGTFVWATQGNTAGLMSLDNSGNLGVGANVSAGGNITATGGQLTLGADAVLTRNGAGQVRVASTGGLTINGQLTVEGSGAGTFGGGLELNHARAANSSSITFRASLSSNDWVVFAEGGYLYHWGPAASGVLLQGPSGAGWAALQCGALSLNSGNLSVGSGNLSVSGSASIGSGLAVSGGNITAPGGNVTIGGSFTAQGVGNTGYAFQTANSAAPAGQGYANAWVNASSIRFKSNVVPMADALSLVQNDDLHGVRYDFVEGNVPQIGFVAEAWEPYVPEIVTTDPQGLVEGMDYARVTTVVFEALKQYAAQTDARLAALEAKAA